LGLGVLIVAGLLVAGCGNGGNQSSNQASQTASASPAPAPTPPIPVNYTPGPNGACVKTNPPQIRARVSNIVRFTTGGVSVWVYSQAGFFSAGADTFLVQPGQPTDRTAYAIGTYMLITKPGECLKMEGPNVIIDSGMGGGDSAAAH